MLLCLFNDEIKLNRIELNIGGKYEHVSDIPQNTWVFCLFISSLTWDTQSETRVVSVLL